MNSKIFRELLLSRYLSPGEAHLEGIFEWMVNNKGELVHQRFIKRYELREKGIRGEYMNQMEEIKRLETEEKNVIAMGRKGIIPEHRVKEQVEDLEKTLTLEKFRFIQKI